MIKYNGNVITMEEYAKILGLPYHVVFREHKHEQYIFNKVCPYCKTTFSTRHNNKKYCSSECSLQNSLDLREMSNKLKIKIKIKSNKINFRKSFISIS